MLQRHTYAHTKNNEEYNENQHEYKNHMTHTNQGKEPLLAQEYGIDINILFMRWLQTE